MLNKKQRACHVAQKLIRDDFKFSKRTLAFNLVTCSEIVSGESTSKHLNHDFAAKYLLILLN